MLEQKAVSIGNNTSLPAISAEEHGDMVTFKHDLKEMLRSGSNVRTGDMVKYLYSSVVPENSNDSGADLWDRVVTFGGGYYYIPMSEALLIDYNKEYLSRMFVEKPTVVDLGPGGFHVLAMKSIPVVKAVDAKSYVAFDLNEAFAFNAQDVVGKAIPNISASFIHGDFTKPHKLSVETPVLMTMFGCTLSQFAFSGENRNGEASFGEVLHNLGEMVGHNAIMIATVDTNPYASSAKNCYIGEHMDQFQRHLWLTAKTLIEASPDSTNNYVAVDGDKSANPADAMVYDPRYENKCVIHSYLTKREMTFVIDGEKFDIHRGTQIDTGISEKWSIEDVKKEVKKTGWSLVNDLEAQTSIHAIVLAGKNVSDEQLIRCKYNAEKAKASIRRPSSPPITSVPPHRRNSRPQSPFGRRGTIEAA